MRANLLWREWAESRKACDSSSPQSRHWPSGCAKNDAIMSKRRDPVKMITQLMKLALPSALGERDYTFGRPGTLARSRLSIIGRLAAAIDDNDKEQ